MKASIMKQIEDNKGKISPRMDLKGTEIVDIYHESKGYTEMICNSFIIGYIRGMRAQKKVGAQHG